VGIGGDIPLIDAAVDVGYSSLPIIGRRLPASSSFVLAPRPAARRCGRSSLTPARRGALQRTLLHVDPVAGGGQAAAARSPEAPAGRVVSGSQLHLAAVWEASVMSSWGAGAQWLTVAGSSLLAYGTWTQARASLIEYRDLFADLPQAARTALEAIMLTNSRTRRIVMIAPGAIISEIPRQLEQIRQEHGEAAARAAQLIRLAAVWFVLSAGAVLILVAAVIQLVLLYA
jgi:hypothetical protein